MVACTSFSFEFQDSTSSWIPVTDLFHVIVISVLVCIGMRALRQQVCQRETM